MKFKEFLTEDSHSDYNGVTIFGDLMTLSIKQDYNDKLRLKIEAEAPLYRIKSVEDIKSEYQEKDWIEIEKIYEKIFNKESKDIEKLVKNFEKDLNKIIKSIEKETGKL